MDSLLINQSISLLGIQANRKSVSWPVRNSVRQAVKKLASQPANQLIGECVNQPAIHSGYWLVKQYDSKSVLQSLSQSIDQSFRVPHPESYWPVNQSIYQLVNQSKSKLASQLQDNKPFSQWSSQGTSCQQAILSGCLYVSQLGHIVNQWLSYLLENLRPWSFPVCLSVTGYVFNTNQSVFQMG